MESLDDLLKRQNAERIEYLKAMYDELDYMQYMSTFPDYDEALQAKQYFKDNFGAQADRAMTDRHNEELFKHPDLLNQQAMEPWEEMEARHDKEKSKKMDDHLNEWAALNRAGMLDANTARKFSDDKKKEIDDLMQQQLGDAMQQPGFKEHVEWQRGEQHNQQSMEHDLDEMTKGRQKADLESEQEIDEMDKEFERLRDMKREGREITRER